MRGNVVHHRGSKGGSERDVEAARRERSVGGRGSLGGRKGGGGTSGARVRCMLAQELHNLPMALLLRDLECSTSILQERRYHPRFPLDGSPSLTTRNEYPQQR